MFWNRSKYPNDADGDALRRIAKDKSTDLSRPMLVDIFVMSHNQASAEAVATEALHIGYDCKVDKDDNEDTWTTTCSKTMLLTYDSIVAAQKQLDDLSAPHDARTDGWGTFGNVE